jgi:hypothetical protein
MTILPPPADASRVSCFLADHRRWSASWDKQHGLWRVAEDDPDSDLYAKAGRSPLRPNIDSACDYCPYRAGRRAYWTEYLAAGSVTCNEGDHG